VRIRRVRLETNFKSEKEEDDPRVGGQEHATLGSKGDCYPEGNWSPAVIPNP
jgi:hypothetical protein